MPYEFNIFTGNLDWYQEGGSSGSFVPYTGATSNVQLGYNSLSAYSLKLSNLSSDASFLEGQMYYRADMQRLLYNANLTSYALASLTDLGAYVKYSGSTGNVDLGVYALSVNDVAYSSAWDASTAVPTRNAVYDKIESLVFGGGIGTISAASDATFGSPAIGDVMYKTSGGYWTNLPIGTIGYVLTSQGTSAAPYWASASGGSGTTSLIRSFLSIGS